MTPFTMRYLWIALACLGGVSWSSDTDSELSKEAITPSYPSTVTDTQARENLSYQEEYARRAPSSPSQYAPRVRVHNPELEYCDCAYCEERENDIEEELRRRYTSFSQHYVANTKSVSTPKEMFDAVMRLTN